VNPVTNKIYVANQFANTVTAIDGATNVTTSVAVGEVPIAVAVNPVTNRVYVANLMTGDVTVIDGVTNDTTNVYVGGASECALAVNPVTGKVYVTRKGSNKVTMIDGATNDTTLVGAPTGPMSIAVNPVTGKVYVGCQDDLAVISDSSATDTKVRVVVNRLPGDTTSLARPDLTGKGVNRWTPGRTAMMGVGNRLSTTQTAWDWASITSGAGTDSVTWSYNWGEDSLIPGESFICCVPLEDQAATTNNLGLGTPFAGNLEVYPVYRMVQQAGVAEAMNDERGVMNVGPSIVRGVLVLPASPRPRVSESTCLLDACGRKVMDLRPGANDVRHLSPGVYFVRTRMDTKVVKILLVD
jgi:YVTN family beta-propeller protein